MTPTRLTGRLLDHEYGLEIEDPELRAYLADVMRDSLGECEKPEVISVSGVPGSTFELRIGDADPTRSDDAAWVLMSLVWQLNRRTVAMSGARALLHAGAVGDASSGVVVVGATGFGKTTSVVALGLAGLPYVTDDVVGVNDDGSVCGALKPLGMRSGGLRLLGLTDVRIPIPPSAYGAGNQIAASSLGLEPVPVAAPRCIVFISKSFPLGVGRELNRSESLVRLLSSSFNEPGERGSSLPALAALVRRCRCVEWNRGPLDSLRELVRADL